MEIKMKICKLLGDGQYTVFEDSIKKVEVGFTFFRSRKALYQLGLSTILNRIY